MLQKGGDVTVNEGKSCSETSLLERRLREDCPIGKICGKAMKSQLPNFFGVRTDEVAMKH